MVGYMLARLKFRRAVRAAKKNEDGATAVEFAILSLPFMALLFGIIEISIVFFLGSTLEHATSVATRKVRTGEYQSAGNTDAAALKSAICNEMRGFGNCANLRIDVESHASGKFKNIVLDDSPQECDGMDNNGNFDQDLMDQCEADPPVMPGDQYTPTASGDVVIVRVQYKYKLSVSGKLTRLANASGNYRIINATTAFRNEPF